jgi:anti-sigma regulatory factor (Ser/Thr protein kinase)
LTNTLEHGFPGRESEAEITVALRREGEWAICRYEDNGDPFNPWEAEKSDPTLALEERSLGGWGLQLIAATLDDVSYAREGDRNVTTLRQRRGSADPA